MPMVVRNGYPYERNRIRSGRKDYLLFKMEHNVTSDQVGLISEKLFYRMAVKLLKDNLLDPHIVGIRKASRIQDKKQQTDFIVTINSLENEQIEVKIQIKSSQFQAGRFEEKHPNCNCYVIVMNGDMTIQAVRSALNDMCGIEIGTIGQNSKH